MDEQIDEGAFLTQLMSDCETWCSCTRVGIRLDPHGLGMVLSSPSLCLCIFRLRFFETDHMTCGCVLLLGRSAPPKPKHKNKETRGFPIGVCQDEGFSVLVSPLSPPKKKTRNTGGPPKKSRRGFFSLSSASRAPWPQHGYMVQARDPDPLRPVEGYARGALENAAATGSLQWLERKHISRSLSQVPGLTVSLFGGRVPLLT